MQCVVLYGSVLQRVGVCVAACCSVLQCVAVCFNLLGVPLINDCDTHMNAAYYTSECSVLQSIAECCSVLQCVAVCYGVLQCSRTPSPTNT